MPLYKNRLENQEEHHLYEIQDGLDDDVFKYGISSDPIEEDGLSSRLRKRIDFMNLVVNWTRFFGCILIRGIKGRAEAKRLESILMIMKNGTAGALGAIDVESEGYSCV